MSDTETKKTPLTVRVTFKDPDVVGDAVKEAVHEWAEKHLAGLDPEEREAAEDLRAEKVRAALSEWVRYGEYITVEFDLDAKTARVLGAR